MSVSNSFSAFLHDAFAEFGTIHIRKMFGGAGVYKDGVMFGLVADDVLYLKADAALAALFEAEEMEPLIFTPANGKAIAMSYWRAPERLFDEPEQLAEWAERSLEVAIKLKRTKKTKKKKPTR